MYAIIKETMNTNFRLINNALRRLKENIQDEFIKTKFKQIEQSMWEFREAYDSGHYERARRALLQAQRILEGNRGAGVKMSRIPISDDRGGTHAGKYIRLKSPKDL